MDTQIKTLLLCLYKKFEGSAELSVSSPEYEQLQIDYLIEEGYITKIDVSTLSGWEYIVKPTYKGKTLLSQLNDSNIDKLMALIKRGEEIGEKEYKPGVEGFDFPRVSGPNYNAWMDEIKIFNERYLSNHPLHDQIDQTYNYRKRKLSSYDDMMGHLQALLIDFKSSDIKNDRESTTAMINNPTIGNMLKEDIERCKIFLENPKDEEEGRILYTDITSKYDSIIPNLGSGLYNCIPEKHWYDPAVRGESLLQNLRIIKNKMISYVAQYYSDNEQVTVIDEKKELSNKVFIVHGHDNEAKQEMARTLGKGGFEPIILHEQPDSGLTIIEKIEKYSDVGFAVVLYTECDYGRAKEDNVDNEKYRARQNVVFEHGYLIAKLGRDHVCALVKGDVETPGDISGVVYVTMDTDGAWKTRLGKNMMAVGLPVDLNTLCV